jgi:exopolysaccharide production protein ExoZ
MTITARFIAAEEPPTRMVYSVQILRGIAALLVMFFHYAKYLKSTVPGADIGFDMFSGGYAGVDVFFIISGFIIVHSTEQKRHAGPFAFSIRRLFRVVPLAQIATLTYFAIISAPTPSRLLWKSLLFLPSADADAPKFGYPVVAQEWTLSYELVFYGVFAAVLIFTHRRRVLAASLALAACVLGFQWLLGGPISLRPNGVALPVDYHGFIPAEILGVLGNPILIEFVAGMALAAAYLRFESRLRHARWRLAERLVGLSLIGTFLASYLSRLDPGNGLLDKGGGACCLVTGGLLLEVSFRRPAAAEAGRCLSAFLWLGSISYSLYLVHAGIAERLLRFTCSLLLGLKVDGLRGFAALIATSLALASASHVFFERRLIRAGKFLADRGQGSSP